MDINNGKNMKDNYSLTKLACYTSNVSMSVTSMISPLLLLTFRELYGISYSLLGLLVLLNFFPQLIIDLIFSFFSHKFNIEKAVRFTPVLTFAGLWVYSLVPLLFPQIAFLGIFSRKPYRITSRSFAMPSESGNAVVKTLDVPATKMFAPATFILAAFSKLTFPSTSISTLSYPRSSR